MDKKRLLTIICGATVILMVVCAIICACVFGWFGLDKKADIGTHINKTDNDLKKNDDKTEITTATKSEVSTQVKSQVNSGSNDETVDAELSRFKSFDEMVTFLLSNNKYNDEFGTRFSGEVRSQLASKAMATEKDTAAEHSSTNTQVSGVDEGDIIKNDGKYIYIASINKISIIEANPADKMKLAGTMSLSENENITEMFLKDNLIVVIGSKYQQNAINSNRKASMEKPASYKVYIDGNKTFVKVFDIADKAKPKLKREINLDGGTLATREKDGKIYIISNKNLYNYIDKDTKPEDILPSYYDSARSKDNITIPANRINYCPQNPSSNYILISVFDINNEKPVSIETVMGAGNNVYMSNENIYITKYYYRYNIIPAESNTTEVSPSLTAKSGFAAIASTAASSTAPDNVVTPAFNASDATVILKFSIKNYGVKYTASAEVPGQIINQYSMDEYNDTFRIATTKNTQSGTDNNLYVLNKDMKMIGKLENLAKGERIYAVRFSGKTAYIVTFKTMDPLFVIDLSNPKLPKVDGELKIPGFSNYLHPIGDNMLIGVGSHTSEIYQKDENGKEIVVGVHTGGVKVSLFDVSNPKLPKEIDNVILGNMGTYSEVQNNPRAFLWWKHKSTAIIPVTEYVYNEKDIINSGISLITVIDRKIIEKGRLIPKKNSNQYFNINRAAYINDYVYVIQDNTITAYNYDNMNKTGSLSFAS